MIYQGLIPLGLLEFGTRIRALLQNLSFCVCLANMRKTSLLSQLPMKIVIYSFHNLEYESVKHTY